MVQGKHKATTRAASAADAPEGGGPESWSLSILQTHPPHVGPETQTAIGQAETGEAQRDGMESLNGGGACKRQTEADWILRVHLEETPSGPRAESGKWAWTPTLTDKLSAIETRWQRKNSFSSGVSLGTLTTLQGRPPSFPGGVGQHKRNYSMVVL